MTTQATRTRRPWKGSTLYRRGDRPGTWWARYFDAKGKRHVRNTGEPDTDEGKVAAERLLAAWTGKVVADVERGVSSVTVADFAASDFFPVVARSASATHLAGLRAKIDRFGRWTGSRPIHAISRADVEKFLAKIQEPSKDADGNDVEPVGPNTVTRYAMALSKLFRKALDAGAATTNPVRGADRPQVSQYAPVELTAEDVDRIIVRAAPDARPALVLLADLGLRVGELLALTWSRVSDDNGLVTVARVGVERERRGTKSGKSRTVPATTRARAVLAELRAARVVPMVGADLVLPQLREPSKRRRKSELRSKSWIEGRFRAAASAAGLPVRPEAQVGVRVHDLRHAFASGLARNGVPLSVIARLIGDSISVTEGRYASHVPGSEAVRAVATLERRPAAAGTQEPQEPAQRTA